MVNASLNWASIVGIALAICGGGLYFLRSFKPALARDYDVFFAAIGLLCGGILFFQGWRLDPILQFGQFLLAGTTVFFAYESVRLRGIATDQARRSSYFDEELESPSRSNPPSYRSSGREDFDQFEDSQPIRRRFSSRDTDPSDYDSPDDDFYGSRRISRPAIPEQAASRRRRSQRDSLNDESMESRRRARFGNSLDEESSRKSTFGDRRSFRQEERRGSRPIANSQTTRFRDPLRNDLKNSSSKSNKFQAPSDRYSSAPKGTPISQNIEDAAFSPKRVSSERPKNLKTESRQMRQTLNNTNKENQPRIKRTPRGRDNTSRFDD